MADKPSALDTLKKLASKKTVESTAASALTTQMIRHSQGRVVTNRL
jgi:hypothetical protein